MDENVVFLTIVAFLVVVFIVSVWLALMGKVPAKYFLWTWAGCMVIALPFTGETNIIASQPAGLMLLFFLYVLIVGKMHSDVQLEVSHEETRRVLAESNRRIDEERRTISRRLHDEVNPSLVLCKNELKRLEPYVCHDEKASKILASVLELIGGAYNETRDLIKNTRIEVIDSIGFTAAIESLVGHYTNFFDKPLIVLEHNLPKRPDLAEDVAVVAYKIIREAIFNAIKHSNAKQITVTLKFNKRQHVINAAVVDDGVGVPPRAKTHAQIPTGIGIIDMRERARVIGGNLKIQPVFPSNEKRPGTKVSFSFSTQSS